MNEMPDYSMGLVAKTDIHFDETGQQRDRMDDCFRVTTIYRLERDVEIVAWVAQHTDGAEVAFQIFLKFV